MLSQVVWHHSVEKLNSIYVDLTSSTDEKIHEILFKEISDGRDTFAKLGEELFEAEVSGGSHKDLEDIFLRLYTYGARAVLPKGMCENDFECAVRFLVFSRCIGELGTGNVPSFCEAVFNLSLSRYKLDVCQKKIEFDWNDGMDWLECWVKFPEMKYLTIAELSALSNMSEQSIRNELSKSGKRFLTNIDRYGSRGAMSVEVAVDWLQKRNDYKSTRQPALSSDDIQIPVASDGTLFGPHCRQGAGFKVGPKGGEVYYENIQEALNALIKMDKPKWRRPNSKGNFGIVTGRNWKTLLKNDWLAGNF